MESTQDKIEFELTADGAVKGKASGHGISKGFSKIVDTIGTTTLTAAAMFFPNKVTKASEVIAQRELVLANARKQVMQIEQGAKTLQEGHLIEVEQTSEMLSPEVAIVEAAERERIAGDLMKEITVAEVSARAVDIIEAAGEENISEEAVDTDWANRWKSHVRNVTTDRAKDVWAKVLAEEVKKPNTVSIRTLEFLNTMSKDDADLARKVMPYIHNGYIFNEGEAKKLVHSTFDFEDLLHLADIGLLCGISDNTHYKFDLNAGGFVNFKFKKGVVCIKNTKDKKIEVSYDVIATTKLFKELCLFEDDLQELDDYRESVMKMLKSKCKGKAEVSLLQP